MKNMYTSVLSRWLFMLLLLSSQTLLAQTAPTIQWQKFTGGLIKQAANGDIILGSGQTISRLNQASGQSIWTTSLPAGFDANIVYDLLVSRDGSIVTLSKDRANYYLARLDASGTVLWNKSFAGTTQSGELTQTTIKSIAQAADGGYVALSSTTYGRNGAGTVLYKFDASGSSAGTSGVSYPYSNAIRPISFGNKVISTPDGGYLVVGATNSGAEPSSLGWAAKLDKNLKQVWTDRYNFASSFTDVIPNPFDTESFIATGQSADFKATTTLVISPTQPGTNNTAGTYRPSLRSAVLVYSISDMSNISIDPQITTSGSGSYEVMDAVDQRSGDIRVVSFGPNNQTRWTKILGGSFVEVPRSIITTATDNLLLTGLTSSSDGDVQGKTGGNVSGWLVKLVPGTPLVLNQPTYDCSTGAITFNVAGGDGSPITFSAPGIMRSSATSNSGTVEQGLRNDPKTIAITATQSGQSTSYSFDLKAACSGPTPTPDPTPTPPPTGGTLTLTQPTYDCSTGAITFNTAGGDGSTITYTAPGIMRSAVTSNTGTVEQGLRNDPKTITITAIQSGYSTSFSFDLKAYCSGTTPLIAPPLLSPIPDQTRIVGKPLTNDTISISSFFGGVGNYPGFRPVILFLTTGLPPGMTIFNNSNENRTSAYIGGTPTTPGVYVVTVSAFISNSTSGNVPTTTTKFQITILDNSTTTPPPTGGTLTLAQPTYNCSTGAITFNTTGGNGAPITYTAPGISRSSVTSNTGIVEQGLRNDPKTITITAIQSGQSTTYSFDLKAFCSGNTPTPSSTLKLLPPVVDCSLRQVTLVTSGGDGSTITFNTPTITRSSATSSVGIVDLCVGAKPPVLQATQSGFTATYESFDFAKQCPAFLSVKPLMASQIPDITLPGPDYRVTLGNYFKTETNPVNRYAPLFKFQLSGAPGGSSIDDQTSTVRSLQPYAFLTLDVSTPGVYTVTVTGRNECEPAASSTFKVTVNPTSAGSPLTLVAPTYNCATGALTFNYTGGNGSPVEFQAAGITSWTTNPNQFVDKDSRTANDVKPFTLMARQNGQLVTYTWDLKAACGRSARMATTEAGQALELTVKGNPVGNTAVVEIRGAEGQAIQLDLLNASGHVLEQRYIEQAGAVDEQRFELQRQPTGLLFLRAQSGQQKQTVKLIKQ